MDSATYLKPTQGHKSAIEETLISPLLPLLCL